MQRNLSSAVVFACMILLTGGVNPCTAIDYVETIDDCFQIEIIEDPDFFYTYRLTNPYSGHSPFVSLGMNGLQSSAYLQAHGQSWTGDDGYPGPLAWIEDQVKFLFNINMNTIAGWLTHIDSGAEDKWYNQQAMLHGYNYSVYIAHGCDCAEEAPEDDFKHENVAANAELVRQVNLKLPVYHQSNSTGYPQPYFPFVLYLYPVTPFNQDEILEDMLPDIWSGHFERRLYLMSFLVLSDGTEPGEGKECEGAWEYAPVIEPGVVDNNGAATLQVPEYFICHRPEGMREWKSLISYALSDDVQWAYSIDDNSSFSGEYRPWIRRILCQACETNEPVPAGRTAFAQAMEIHYALDTDPVKKWNDEYYNDEGPVPDNFDFRISRFMEADDPDPRYAEFPSLEEMPNPDCETCLKNHYPNGINEGNNDDIADWLRDSKSDLGYVLTVDDAAEFTRVMATHFYPLVIDAIRFFDGCHMISSANFNWFRKGGDFDYMVQFYPVFEEMSKATGNVFTDAKDCISYINTQFSI